MNCAYLSSVYNNYSRSTYPSQNTNSTISTNYTNNSFALSNNTNPLNITGLSNIPPNYSNPFGNDSPRLFSSNTVSNDSGFYNSVSQQN